MTTTNATFPIFIKDLSADKFYCVQNLDDMSNSFPFWDYDVAKAYNFTTVELAKHEMNMNDFSQYEAVIIELETVIGVWYDSHDGIRYIDNDNSTKGTSNEYEAKIFDSKEEAQAFIDSNDYVSCTVTDITLELIQG